MGALASDRGLHNVPAELTSFVGRRRELAEIKHRLASSRLLTLTGPGGVGKTRLAHRAASEMVRAFPDGVWLVSLAPIQDPPLVAQAVFDALGLQDTSAGWSLATLTDYLARKRLLLLLDNCEHLLESSAVLASTLLNSCSEVRVLATSRQALGTMGEARMRVPPLSLPRDDRPVQVRDLLDFDAVTLLVDRIQLVASGFRLGEGNAAGVLRLCRRLDGIPLALELAAIQLEALGLDDLNLALDREQLELRGHRGLVERQQTLDATLGWSYRLLTEQERRLWARLSVFAGGFDHDAAIQVCSDRELPDRQLLGLLVSLVEKSIVKPEWGQQQSRYELLEPIRQFGQQRLHESGNDEIETRTRHRDWVLNLAVTAGAWDHRQVDAFNRIYLERNNVWAALEFCTREPGEAGRGLEIAGHLWVYWQCRGPLNDVRRVIAALLDRVPSDSISRAQGLWLGAATAVPLADFEETHRMAEEGERLAEVLGDQETVAWSREVRGIAAWAQGRPEEASVLIESAIELAKSTGNWRLVLAAQDALCGMRLAGGDLHGAIAVGEEALTTSRQSGELWVRGYLLGFLAEARWRQGDLRQAELSLKEAIACKQALDDRSPGLALLVETMAWMAAERGAADAAATLLGCAEQLRELAAARIFGPQEAQHEQSVSFARQRLGDVAYTAAFERGRAMSPDNAVAYALDQKTPIKSSPPKAVETPSPLTRREQQIAVQIADGLSNKQIASKLVISERTVDTHVWNILNKLGVNSRSQIASWVTARRSASDSRPS